MPRIINSIISAMVPIPKPTTSGVDNSIFGKVNTVSLLSGPIVPPSVAGCLDGSAVIVTVLVGPALGVVVTVCAGAVIVSTGWGPETNSVTVAVGPGTRTVGPGTRTVAVSPGNVTVMGGRVTCTLGRSTTVFNTTTPAALQVTRT